jgi:hypothetical protein
LKMSFPTKTPVLLLQWGSKKVNFWGGRGRTGFCKKCRHYYIAIFDNLIILDPPIFNNFHPTEHNIFFYLITTQFVRQKSTPKNGQNLVLKIDKILIKNNG